MASSRAREIAKGRYAPIDGESDKKQIATNAIEACIQTFAREMAEKIRAKHIMVDSSHWRAALNECANTILDAAGITEGRDEK